LENIETLPQLPPEIIKTLTPNTNSQNVTDSYLRWLDIINKRMM